MKSDRRHELQANVLLTVIARVYEQARPYGKSIAAVAVLAAVAAGFWAVSSRQIESSFGYSPQASGEAWLNFYHAFGENDADALQEIAKKNPELPAGIWARQMAADVHLAEGSAQLYTDRDQARASLDLAITGYGEVIDAATEPMLLQRAYFGLGQAHECMAVLASKPDLVKNQLEMARAKYQKLVDRWPQSILALSANARIEQISTPEGQEFYVWFSQQEPFKPGAGLSGGGFPGPGAFDLNALPGAQAPLRSGLEQGADLLELDPDEGLDSDDATPAEGGAETKDAEATETPSEEGPELTPAAETSEKTEAPQKPKGDEQPE